MRKLWVGGNWKMNGHRAELITLTQEMVKLPIHFDRVDVALFPSFIYLSSIKDLLSKSQIRLGAQNLSEYEKGAYTGEISASMIQDMGCEYVLVGHSERRQIYKESPATEAEKFYWAIKNKLKPVLCLGETRQEREANKTESVILTQLQAVIDKVGIAAFEKAIVAYEPVWAIGTGLTATPEQAQAIHALIRSKLTQLSSTLGKAIRIVYGGSVKSDNAKALFEQPDVDGGLIGGASLKANEFGLICKAAEEIKK